MRDSEYLRCNYKALSLNVIFVVCCYILLDSIELYSELSDHWTY